MKASRTRPHTASAAARLVHFAEVYGDLAVYASQTVKEPDADHCTLVFHNPRQLKLRNLEVAGTSKQAQAQKQNELAGESGGGVKMPRDTFTSTHMYMTFYSQNGCTVSLAGQFPEEEKKSSKNDFNATTSKAFRIQTKLRVKEQIEELTQEKFMQRSYFRNLENLKKKLIIMRKGTTFENCQTDFIKQNLEQVNYFETKA